MPSPLGVSPTSFGYKTFTVNPHLGGIEWIEGRVPINKGYVDVYMAKKEIVLNITDKISPKINEMDENINKITALLKRNAELTIELLNGINVLVE